MELPKKIFYLDDDLDDLYFFKEVVESLGHEVSIYINGKELLRSLNSKSVRPDIIFLDIRMPVFNGEEILQIIKKDDQFKDIPVVMISGYNSKSLVRQYLDAGANYLMKKPSSMVDYKSSVERVLDIDWENFQAFA